MNHHFIVTMELTSCLGRVDSYAICKEERECESNSEYYNVQYVIHTCELVHLGTD